MQITKRGRQLSRVASVVARHPAEARNVPRLLRTQGKPTLMVRIPWLPFAVVDLLAEEVDREARVYEFGGGGSTAWFADHAGQVFTVEHDPEWHAMLDQAMRPHDYVDVRFATADGPKSPYVTSIDTQPDDSVDIVVVDGRQRVACTARAMSKVKPGGLLILDDSDRAKYADAHEALRNWDGRTYFGLVPCKDEPSHTTVWRRPES